MSISDGVVAALSKASLWETLRLGGYATSNRGGQMISLGCRPSAYLSLHGRRRLHIVGIEPFYCLKAQSVEFPFF